MKQVFAEALHLVLAHDGGYVNHPADPGGATNRGVTQATYDAWRRAQGLAVRAVRHIDVSEIQAVYRQNYWNRVHGDDMPAGVDYAVFDFAVNSGPKRAAQFLQRVVGVADDGVIGPVTLKAVARRGTAAVVPDLCSARLAWLKTLKHWPTFGRGWSRRVVEVERVALDMAAGRGTAASLEPPSGSPPHPEDSPPVSPVTRRSRLRGGFSCARMKETGSMTTKLFREILATLGGGSAKAHASGAVAVLLTVAGPAVDGFRRGFTPSLEETGVMLGAAAGAYLVGHIAAWLPANRA